MLFIPTIATYFLPLLPTRAATRAFPAKIQMKSPLSFQAKIQMKSPLSRRASRRKRGAVAERARKTGTVVMPKTNEGVRRPFRYLCVLDVEATCERNQRHFQHEIIELPVVLVDLETLSFVDEFHTFVRPTANRTLSQFCTDLTGITQEAVDAAPTLDVVLVQLHEWLTLHSLETADADGRHNFAFATDGPWDLNFFLDGECARKGIPKAEYYDKWVNLKQLFADFYHCPRCKIARMLEHQGMRFEGRLHSGIDDTRNIARIARKMAQDGCTMYLNEALPAHRKSAMVQALTWSR